MISIISNILIASQSTALPRQIGTHALAISASANDEPKNPVLRIVFAEQKAALVS